MVRVPHATLAPAVYRIGRSVSLVVRDTIVATLLSVSSHVLGVTTL